MVSKQTVRAKRILHHISKTERSTLMSKTLYIFTICIIFCLGFSNIETTAAASAKNTANEGENIDHSVFGLWASPGSIFRTYLENGTVKGEILALREPVYTKEESVERAGQIRLDDNNPDENLKLNPIVGMNIYSEYTFKDGQWQGKIYDPESGNTYQSKMKLKAGALEIRGYIGVPMFGRTAKFKPVESCTDEFRPMLASINEQDRTNKGIDVSCD